MSDHFAAFTFVDRITDLEPGTRARGAFAIPARVREFPPCLVAEAVGQLAAWVSMSHIDFRGRPVAALATETRFHRGVRPGDALDLGVEIEHCDDDAVAYSGWASVGGERVIELIHCLGPMLPVGDFDSPESLRDHFALLCKGGSRGETFAGVDAQEVIVTEHIAGKSVCGELRVPRHARFFADHFPRNPVFPATLLLDSQIRLAASLVQVRARSGAAPVPTRMTHVKMRSFIKPGQLVQIHAALSDQRDDTMKVALSANIDGKTVATARVEFAAKGDL